MRARDKILRTFQHADTQFPSGAFAFSQGLEALSQQQDRLGKFDLWNFLHAQIVHRWASSERVVIAKDVTEEQLYALHAHAAATVVPTLFEGGFPWQGLEAMLMNTPAITAK